MAVTLAYDVYGTLIDTDGIAAALEPQLGGQAGAFARLWRQKQLEYAFRRGLMQRYRDFGVCTSDALAYACVAFGVAPSGEEKARLMGAYAWLPAFDDARDGLERAREAGFRCYAFSNGRADAVEEVLRNAGIRELLLEVISVDEVRTFKPSPLVYEHFLRRTGAEGDQAWLVSANGFDVIGALAAGMRAAWLRRTPGAPLDPWGLEPGLTVATLSELPGRVAALTDGPG
ncbi:MAG: haloacid dehalogenase type II [Chromatiales bacterium]